MEKIKAVIKKLDAKQIYIIRALAFLAIASILLTWFLEYRYFINNAYRAWSFSIGSPAPFFFNAFLMWLMLVFLWGLFRKPGTAVGVMWGIIIIVTYIHINKYNSRGFPLSPEDFQLATEASALSKFVSVWSIVRLVLAIIIVAALTILFNRKFAEKIKLVLNEKSSNFIRNHQIGLRLILVALSVVVFMLSTDFARHNNGSRYEHIFLGTHFTAWNQNRNYDDNGFILGFLYNLQKLRLSKPDNYSEEKILGIKNKYDEVAKNNNISRLSAADEDVSIIIILNESFYDPAVEFQGLKFEDYYPHTGGDVTPNLHSIMSKYPSGYMYTLDYGGGTANIEYETFTGLTNFWTNTVPYTALIPKAGKILSVANYYKNQDYETVAIHPYNGGMYKRNISLPNEGFDKFIDVYDMDFDERDGNSQYVNDDSAYRQVLKELESTDKKQMIGLITMQNHTPYDHDIYEQTDFKIMNDEIEEGKRDDIAIYYQSLHNSDKYLGKFIEELDKLDKKVAVLFYGDHSAGLFSLVNENEKKEVRDLSRVVPYFVYTNYETNYTETKLPTTTPNCMANTMHNVLNWQKESYLYLVDDVCRTEPILTATWLDERGLNEDGVLDDYKLLTYDVLGGKKYWMK